MRYLSTCECPTKNSSSTDWQPPPSRYRGTSRLFPEGIPPNPPTGRAPLPAIETALPLSYMAAQVLTRQQLLTIVDEHFRLRQNLPVYRWTVAHNAVKGFRGGPEFQRENCPPLGARLRELRHLVARIPSHLSPRGRRVSCCVSAPLCVVFFCCGCRSFVPPIKNAHPHIRVDTHPHI